MIIGIGKLVRCGTKGMVESGLGEQEIRELRKRIELMGSCGELESGWQGTGEEAEEDTVKGIPGKELSWEVVKAVYMQYGTACWTACKVFFGLIIR